MDVPMSVKLDDLPAWRAHVVIACEDPGLRVQLEETLSRDGHRVSAVEDGLELLERLGDPSGDAMHLVIADVELSGFTGLEVLGLTDGAVGRPPVVLMVPRGDASLAHAARQFGATAVMPRPFDLDELRLLVGSLLKPIYRGSAVRAA